MPMPPFISDRPRKDNWQAVARVQSEARAAAQVMHPIASFPHVDEEEEHHIF
jgi:hypothetical protein